MTTVSQAAPPSASRDRAPPPGGAGRRALFGLALALGVGLLVRVGALWWAWRHQPDFAFPALDAQVHDWWARGLALGEWELPAGMPDPELASTPYYRPPGYPLFLALSYAISRGSYLAARVAQLLVGLGTVALVWLIARRLVERASPGLGVRAWAPTVAGLAFALSPAAVYFEGELVAASLSAFLVAAAGLLGLRLLDEEGRRAWLTAAGLGVVIGLGAVVRPNLIVLLPAAAFGLWMARGERPPWPTRVALIAVVALLCTSPVTVRNAVRGGEAIWVSLNAEITLLYGNHPDATGHQMKLPSGGLFAEVKRTSSASYPAFKRAVESASGRELSYAELAGLLRRQVIDFAWRRPGELFALSGKKAFLLLGPDEVSNNKQVAAEIEANPFARRLPGRWALLAPLALLGLVLLLRRAETRPGAAWLGAATALLLGAVIPFLAAARFRAPALPLLAAMAGPGLVLGVAALRDFRSRKLVAVTLLAGGLLFSVPWAGYEPDRGRWHLDRAEAYIAAGDDERARAELDEALKVDPGQPGARLSRGLLFARAGRWGDAELDLRQAAESDDPRAVAALAAVRAQSGRVDQETLALLRSAVEAAPDAIEPRYNYGLVLFRAGRSEEAREAYEAVLARRPQHLGALNNLGRTLLQLREPRAAAARFAEVLELEPDHREAAFNRAVALGRYDPSAAEAAYRALLEREPAHLDALTNLGALLIEDGRAQAALEPLTQAAELSPAPGPLLNLARARMALGQAPAALATIEQAQAARARRPQAPGPSRQQLWLTELELLLTSPAVRDLGRAGELGDRLLKDSRGSHPLPWMAHAAVLDAAGRPAEAADARQRARALCEQDPELAGFCRPWP